MTTDPMRGSAAIGVIPAAGQGTRLDPFSYPKELLPIAYSIDGRDAGLIYPRPVLQFSLDLMKIAGIATSMIVIADWKLEIARVFGDGTASGISLSYVMRNVPLGLADSIDAAYPWVRDRDVCLALPDTLLSPADALDRIMCERLSSYADVVLGVFPTTEPDRLGPVRVDRGGRVIEVLDKPKSTDLQNTWGLAVWSPRFTALLHETVAKAPANEKPTLGAVFQRAVELRYDVRALCFDGGMFLDLGTPEGLGKLNGALQPLICGTESRWQIAKTESTVQHECRIL